MDRGRIRPEVPRRKRVIARDRRVGVNRFDGYVACSSCEPKSAHDSSSAREPVPPSGDTVLHRM